MDTSALHFYVDCISKKVVLRDEITLAKLRYWAAYVSCERALPWFAYTAAKVVEEALIVTAAERGIALPERTDFPEDKIRTVFEHHLGEKVDRFDALESSERTIRTAPQELPEVSRETLKPLLKWTREGFETVFGFDPDSKIAELRDEAWAPHDHALATR